MKLYLIESIKWSNTANYDGTVYWGWNDCGYTTNFNLAGVYTEDDVKNNQGYYNNDVSTKAVELNAQEYDENSIVRMKLHYERKTEDLKETELLIKKLEKQLHIAKESQTAIKENIEKLKFEINQQHVFKSIEPIK